jgi:hypothetical protein
VGHEDGITNGCCSNAASTDALEYLSGSPIRPPRSATAAAIAILTDTFMRRCPSWPSPRIAIHLLEGDPLVERAKGDGERAEWTILGSLMPLTIALSVTFVVAQMTGLFIRGLDADRS